MNKKHHIIRAAVWLFANQGFDDTTTLQIAIEANVTEPLIYYHFKNKDRLFTHILEESFHNYFTRLDILPEHTGTEFEKIRNLIAQHFEIVEDMPDEIYILMSACPAKLRDPKDICVKYVQKQRRWLTTYLASCLERGILNGEFHEVSIDGTVDIIIALVNGVMRQRCMKLQQAAGMKTATIDFCRRSLVK